MINSARLYVLLLLICSTSLLACSDDTKNGGIGGPNKCGQIAPCGGDVVGHWTIDGACVDPDALDNADLESVKQACPGLTYKTSYDASGTADFTATSYTYDMDIQVTATANVPSSCRAAIGLTCSQLGTFLTDAIGAGSGTTISCTGSSDCTCVVVAPQPRVESGTYTTDGTILTTTPTSGTAASSPYCVNGATLHVITLGDMMSIVSDIVGVR